LLTLKKENYVTTEIFLRKKKHYDEKKNQKNNLQKKNLIKK